jgi:hypothetical protein
MTHFRQRVFKNGILHQLSSGEFIVLLSLLSPQSECTYINIVFVCSLSIIPERVSMRLVFLLSLSLVLLDVVGKKTQHESFPSTKQRNCRDDYISRY